MVKKYKNLFSNFITFGIGSIGSKLILFLLVPLYTHYLSSSEYGTSDLVINLSNLLVPFVSLTFQDSILRFGLSKGVEKGAILKNSMIVLLFGITVSCIIYYLLGMYESIVEWRIYLITIVITSCGNIFLSYYAKIKEKNKLFAISSIVQAFTIGLMNVVLIVFFSMGIRGFLISNIVANILSFVVLFVFTGSLKDLVAGKVDYILLKQMLVFSVPLIINNVSWWILNSSDKVMIEQFVGTSQLGIYAASSKIPSLLSLLTSIFASAWSISSIKEFETTKDFSFYSNIFKHYCLVLFLGGATLLLFAKDFYFIYVGKEYSSGWICLPFLICGILFFSVSSFFGSIYGAAKKNLPTTISTLLSGIVNIVLNLLMLKHYGIVAAAFSTFVSYFFIAMYRMFDSRRFISFKIDFLNFFINCFIIIGQMIFVFLGLNPYLIGVISVLCLVMNNFKELSHILKIFMYKIKMVVN